MDLDKYRTLKLTVTGVKSKTFSLEGCILVDEDGEVSYRLNVLSQWISFRKCERYVTTQELNATTNPRRFYNYHVYIFGTMGF